MLSSTEDHDTNKTQFKIFRKKSHISQEIHDRAITAFSKQSLERLTDTRNALSDVSLHCGGSPWKDDCFIGAVSLGEGAGPQRGHCRALDEAKVWAHALLPTVSCGTEPMYTQ